MRTTGPMLWVGSHGRPTWVPMTAIGSTSRLAWLAPTWLCRCLPHKPPPPPPPSEQLVAQRALLVRQRSLLCSASPSCELLLLAVHRSLRPARSCQASSCCALPTQTLRMHRASGTMRTGQETEPGCLQTRLSAREAGLWPMWHVAGMAPTLRHALPPPPHTRGLLSGLLVWGNVRVASIECTGPGCVQLRTGSLCGPWKPAWAP